MFDIRRITLFCLEKRLSKHKMTIFSKNWGEHGPFGLPLAMPMQNFICFIGCFHCNFMHRSIVCAQKFHSLGCLCNRFTEMLDVYERFVNIINVFFISLELFTDFLKTTCRKTTWRWPYSKFSSLLNSF